MDLSLDSYSQVYEFLLGNKFIDPQGLCGYSSLSSILGVGSSKKLWFENDCSKSKNAIVRVCGNQEKYVQGYDPLPSVYENLLQFIKTFTSPSWFNLINYLPIPCIDNPFNRALRMIPCYLI